MTSPPLIPPTRLFIEQLPEALPISMELSSTSPTFLSNPARFGGCQQVESSGGTHELNMDQFIMEVESHEWTQMTQYYIHYRL